MRQKFSFKKKFILFAILFLLISSAILLSIRTIRNRIFRFFLNDNNYYAYIIQMNLLDLRSADYDDKNSFDEPIEYHADVTITPSSTFKFAASLAGLSNENFAMIEKYSDISSSVTSKSSSDGDSLVADVTYSDGTTSQLGLVYTNKDNMMYYSLGDNWVSKKSNAIYRNIFDFFMPAVYQHNVDNYNFSETKVKKIAIKCILSIFNNIKNVTVTKEDYTSLDGNTISCDHFCMEMSCEQLESLTNDVYNNIISDKDCIKMLQSYNISTDELPGRIDSFFDYVKQYSDNPVTIDSYADTNGKLISNRIRFIGNNSQNSTLGLTFSSEEHGDTTYCDIILEKDSKNVVSYSKEDTVKNDVHNGEIFLDIPDTQFETLTISIKDYKVIDEKYGYAEGNIDVSPSILSGLLNQHIELTTDGSSQKITSKVSIGGKKIISADIKYYPEDFSDITIP